MNSGSSPCAPRYLEGADTSPGTPPWPGLPAKSLPPPLNIEVAPVSVPVSWAISFSTGPPGANCTMTKVTSMMPNIVGHEQQQAAKDIGGHSVRADLLNRMKK